MYGYFTHQLQIFKPSYPHKCTGLTVRFSIQKHQTNYSSHKLELPVFINLRKYSKFNPYSSFYLKTKTKKKKRYACFHTFVQRFNHVPLYSKTKT